MVNTHEQQQLERARLSLITQGPPVIGGARRGEDIEGVGPQTFAPESGRWRGMIRREHIPAVVVGLALVLLIGWLLLGRSQATELPVAQPSVEMPSPTATSPPAMVRVHVLGGVAQPGVVSVPEGSIVEDAIAAAGGMTSAADPAELNLAAPLSDGQQIIVGTTDNPRGEVLSPGGHTGESKLNLNSATVEELQTLPGVGPVLAQAIVDWRVEHGSFTDVSQLEEVTGVGPKLMAKLADLVVL